MRPNLAVLTAALVSAWSPASTTHSFTPSTVRRRRPSSPHISTVLHGGVGVAETYSWKEEQFEIEVKMKVPPKTSARDIKFRCSSESIDLRLGDEILLDGSRKVRGKVCVDGTFWSIEGNPEKEREVTVTIEKHFVPSSSAGGVQTFDAVTDFDWGGLYPNDEEEVSYRKYDEAEELDVREYAAKLGVDIDNIDMSKVNKTMFGAGLGNAAEGATGGFNDNLDLEGNDVGSDNDKGFHFNITQATLDQLTKAGLAKEVVQQGDGTEYKMGRDGMKEDMFSMLGKGVSDDELREAGILGGTGGGGGDTMWETVPVREAPGYQKMYDKENSLVNGIIEGEIEEREVNLSGEEALAVESDNDVNFIEANDSAEVEAADEQSEDAAASVGGAADPIDMLTVARLKEILRAQGLKVSGKKQELRDRLRSHVNKLLLDKK